MERLTVSIVIDVAGCVKRAPEGQQLLDRLAQQLLQPLDVAELR